MDKKNISVCFQSTNQDGVTPLQKAVELAKTNMAQLLVRSGADIEKKAKFGQQKRNAVEVMYLSHDDLNFFELLEEDLHSQVVSVML